MIQVRGHMNIKAAPYKGTHIMFLSFPDRSIPFRTNVFEIRYETLIQEIFKSILREADFHSLISSNDCDVIMTMILSQ